MHTIEQLSASPQDCQRVAKLAWQPRDFDISPQNRAERARIFNRFYNDGMNRRRFQEMYNTNTIDTDLKRVVLLQEMLQEFKVPLLALRVFSTVFSDVPLEGTDKMGIPFYPLQGAGNTQDWNSGTGYNTMANTTTNIREVTIGGDGTNSGSSATVGTAKNRKYLGLSFSSYEYQRQPYFKVEQLVRMNANRLAVDIVNEIISRVITAANYGGTVSAVSGSAFSADDVANLYGQATNANWPLRNRALVLDHTYNVGLIKDPAFKQYLAYGSTDPMRKATIAEAYGFDDIVIVPNLTSYSPAGENLSGWICMSNAALIGFAPIQPAPEVMKLLSRFEIVTDADTGISLSYRGFADVVTDVGKEVVECSFGAAIGVASALKRITSQ